MKSLTGSLILAADDDAAYATPPQLQISESTEELAEGWQALEAAASCPTQHFIWARAYQETYGVAARLQVLSIGPLQAPLAIAPLVRRPGALPRLELLGV